MYRSIAFNISSKATKQKHPSRKKVLQLLRPSILCQYQSQQMKRLISMTRLLLILFLRKDRALEYFPSIRSEESLAIASSKYSLSISKPTNEAPNLNDAIAVDPIPKKGSSTRVFSFNP